MIMDPAAVVLWGCGCAPLCGWKGHLAENAEAFRKGEDLVFQKALTLLQLHQELSKNQVIEPWRYSEPVLVLFQGVSAGFIY